MTEPTEAEIREMCAWADCDTSAVAFESRDDIFGEKGPPVPVLRPIAWNDGRLLLAMMEKLGEEIGTTYAMTRIARVWARASWTLPDAIWAACMEVRK